MHLSSQAASPRILIVDDDPSSVRLIGVALMPDYQCEFALSGERALARLRQEAEDPPALILVDVVMPEMDGYALCRAIQAEPRLKDIPLICVTAKQDPESECSALQAGAVDFIAKPINPMVLRLRIELQLRLRQRERALRMSKTQLDMALKAAGMGVWDYEIATGRMAWAGQHSALLGLPAAELGETLEDLLRVVHPEDRAQVRTDFQRALTGQVTFDSIYRIAWPDGSLHWMHSVGQLIQDAGDRQPRLMGTSRDISMLKAYQAQLEQMAHYDALTGLPNRVLLDDRMRQAMARSDRSGKRFALAFMDLDGFKSVNDAHGHAVGDLLLTVMAQRLKQVLRESDTLARLGGDEFVAMLVDCGDDAAALSLVERLCATAARPVRIGDTEMQLSASLGVTFYPQAGAPGRGDLLRQADKAMYEAKEAGKNRYQVARLTSA